MNLFLQRERAENIKASMNEAYAAVESALPEKYKGMVKNETRTDKDIMTNGNA